MFETLLVTVLAAAVTVAETGLVFQPAVSPDGTQVAYAADENGVVSIYVSPTAPTPGTATARTRIAQIASVGTESQRAGSDAARLATHVLLHQPWSADSKQLIFLVPSPTAVPDGGSRISDILWVVSSDGSDPRVIGPADGLVENASWLPGNRVVFTHRENKQDHISEVSESERVYIVDAATGFNPDMMSDTDTLKEAFAADLAPSPDGRFLALIQLSGPRDQRKRRLRVFDTQSAKPMQLEETAFANFLTWATDSSKLFFVNTGTHNVSAWVPGDAASQDARIDDVASMVAIPGALLAMDTHGVLTTRNLATGARGKELGCGFAPISAAGTKVAFIRRGRAGAAVIVADVTPEAIAAGDIGLPKDPSGEKPPAPPAPPKPPATNGGDNGSLRPVPAGTVVPPQPPG